MTDKSGDHTKQPAECESKFIPFSEQNQKTIWDSPNATGRWTQCPHIKSIHEDMDGERYACDRCGKTYYLDYDSMR